jgi:hypothetical protein
VLVNPRSHKKFAWLSTFSTYIPDGAFLAGKENHIDLYVARVIDSSGLMYLGKYYASINILYFTNSGERKELKENIEVLCVSQ